MTFAGVFGHSRLGFLGTLRGGPERFGDTGLVCRRCRHRRLGRRRPDVLCWRDPRPPLVDYTFDELAEMYPEAIFHTAAEAMAAADLHYWEATIVWRLPCGAFVWTPVVDTCTRSDGNCVPLRDLWIGRNTDPGPIEVCSRDTADSGWD